MSLKGPMKSNTPLTRIGVELSQLNDTDIGLYTMPLAPKYGTLRSCMN